MDTREFQTHIKQGRALHNQAIRDLTVASGRFVMRSVRFFLKQLVAYTTLNKKSCTDKC